MGKSPAGNFLLRSSDLSSPLSPRHELLHRWRFLTQPLRMGGRAVKNRSCLEGLEAPSQCGRGRFLEQRLKFLFAERMKGAHRFECLITNPHAVDARDYHQG